MYTIWTNSKTYQYGLLVAPISIFLVLYNRHIANQLKVDINYFYLLMLIFIVGLWWLGESLGIQVIQHLMVVLFAINLLLLTFGINVLKKLGFPILFLLFCVPFGEEIVPQLQEITHFGVVSLLKLFSFQYEVDGLFIFVRGHIFEVARDCSGIRYFMITIIFSCLYSYFMKLPKNVAVVFIVLSILFPMFLNILRALFIVFIAVYSSNEMALGFAHTIYGLIFFVFNIFILLLIGLPTARRIASFANRFGHE